MQLTEKILSALVVSVLLVGIGGPVLAQDTALSQSEVVDIVVACERAEHDYALYRSRNDAENFANAFTEDGIWYRASGDLVGRQAIADHISARAARDAERPPEYHMQFNTTIQIKPVNATTAKGVSYALVLGSPVPEGGGPATTIAGFQTASESRSTYRITDEGCKIATREYTTFFVDPE